MRDMDTQPHPHIEDAPELRRYMLERFQTDFDVSDFHLAAQAERAKAYLAFSGYKWSWQSVAANAILLAHRGPGRQ
jgi:hypothetical protein